MKLLTCSVSGLVDGIREYGTLTVVKLKQGDYFASVLLGKGVSTPLKGQSVSYNGTAKIRPYKDEMELQFWANEVLA